jgi:hypothetical protein
MWFDASLCMQWPRMARWTVYAVGLRDETQDDLAPGQGSHEFEMTEVRFRWRRSASAWITMTHNEMAKEGKPYIAFEVRPLHDVRVQS